MGRYGEQISVTQPNHAQGFVGEAPRSRWTIVSKSLEKKLFYCYIWITFRTFPQPNFERTKFWRFESQLRKLSCSVL